VSAGHSGGRGIRLDARPAWVVSFAGAAGDEARPSISSGSQQPTHANAGEVAERTRLLTVRGKARAVRGVGREASSDRGTPTGASHVPVAFAGPTAEGGCLGPLRTDLAVSFT
jgi:hypothetical protein